MSARLAGIVAAGLAAVAVPLYLMVSSSGADTTPERLDELMTSECEDKGGNMLDQRGPAPVRPGFLKVLNYEGMKFARAIDTGDPELTFISCGNPPFGPRYFEFDSRRAMLDAAHSHSGGPTCVLRAEPAFFDVAPGRVPGFCEELGGTVIPPMPRR